ncbi:MAG: cell division protein FtsQ/DivIB [Candidatus Acidiferrales bacterium]
MAEAGIRAEEVMVEDEPRYLRRQRPVEIRRRKFGKQAWRLYARVAVLTFAGAALVWVGYETGQFFYRSPRVVLADLESIEVNGAQRASVGLIREKFAADRGVSVMRVPLKARRAAIEEIPWVQRAQVSRVWPDGIRVEIAERTPVAFLRMSTDLALIDGEGVILDRPLEGNYRFPVVTGISEITAREVRRLRMTEFTRFLEAIGRVRASAGDMVSEVDLRDANDLRSTLTGLPGDPRATVLVHFGAGDYGDKFLTLLENIGAWRAQVGRVESVDLRFESQVVVNPEARGATARGSGSEGNTGQ